MRIPTLEGLIRRRILVNYRIDAAAMRRVLPARFEPKLHRGYAIAGICLIRLESIRPKAFPAFLGMQSENAAHRIAVCWRDESGHACEGVYVPRRDTDSRLNSWVGGRIFPGVHHLARFQASDCNDRVSVEMISTDRTTAISIAGHVADALPASSVFESVASASAFFQAGALGFSPTRNPCRFDGIVLDVPRWHVRPLTVTGCYSSYFVDESRFPPGAIEFDHALLMRDVAHRWHSAPDFAA